MKCFQDLKFFCQTVCIKSTPFKTISKWKDTEENKVFMHSLLTQTTIYKLGKGWSIQYACKAFCKSNISYSLIRTHTRAYQGLEMLL